MVTCLHNVCDIKEKVDGDALYVNIGRSKIYLPSDPKHCFKACLDKYFFDEDLLVLKIAGFSPEEGFCLEENLDVGDIDKQTYSAAGYPDYADGHSIDLLQDIKVRSSKRLLSQKLYVIDKQFRAGTSGGPVFNSDNRVVGYIDRGDENTAESKLESAFCLLPPLLADNE